MLSNKLYKCLKYKKREKLTKCNCIIMYKKLCYSASFLVGLEFYNFFEKTAFLFTIQKLHS